MLTWRCSALSFCSASGFCFRKRSIKARVEATVSWAVNNSIRQFACTTGNKEVPTYGFADDWSRSTWLVDFIDCQDYSCIMV